MSRILVTGAAGFIGSHTVDVLLAEGATVLGVDDLSSGKLENLSVAKKTPGFSFENRDVSDEASMTTLTASFRPDAIIHLAALVSVPIAEENPRLNYRLNVRATQIVAEAARMHEVKRIVFASSAAVYGDADESLLPLREDGPAVPAGQYGAAKQASETILLGYAASFGLTPLCFRYFNVFGPRQDPKSPYSGVVSIFLDKARGGEAPVIYGDGRQSRDFIFVKDIAEGNARAALDPSFPAGVYNRCTGDSTTLLDLVNVLRKEFPALPEPEFTGNRPGDIRHSLGDPEKARTRLGLVATTPFAEGMAELMSVEGEVLDTKR